MKGSLVHSGKSPSLNHVVGTRLGYPGCLHEFMVRRNTSPKQKNTFFWFPNIGVFMSIIHDWLYKNQPMNLRFHQQEPGPTNRQSCWERKASEPPHIGLRRPKCWCCLCRCFQIIGAMIFRWVFGWCPTVTSILMLQILIQSCPSLCTPSVFVAASNSMCTV